MEIISNDDGAVVERYSSNHIDYLYRKYKEFFMTGGDLNCRALSHHCRYYDSDGREYESIYCIKHHLPLEW